MTASYLRTLGFTYAPTAGETRCDECRAGTTEWGTECDRCSGTGYVPAPCAECGDALDDDGSCPACAEALALLTDQNAGAAEHRVSLAGNLARASKLFNRKAA